MRMTGVRPWREISLLIPLARYTPNAVQFENPSESLSNALLVQEVSGAFQGVRLSKGSEPSLAYAHWLDVLPSDPCHRQFVFGLAGV